MNMRFKERMRGDGIEVGFVRFSSIVQYRILHS